MIIFILFSGALAAGSPYLFIRLINIFALICFSGALGAFIREMVLIAKKEKSDN